jgi:hypothetical protein
MVINRLTIPKNRQKYGAAGFTPTAPLPVELKDRAY